MDDNIIGKILKNNDNDNDYENILSNTELLSIKEYIESLKKENSIYHNLYNFTDGFMLSNLNSKNQIKLNDEINNITFNTEFKIIDIGVEIINFLSFVSSNGHYIKINFDYDKIKIEDNKLEYNFYSGTYSAPQDTGKNPILTYYLEIIVGKFFKLYKDGTTPLKEIKLVDISKLIKIYLKFFLI